MTVPEKMATAPPASADQMTRKISYPLILLALLLLSLFAARQASSWPARIRYPGELNVIEGMRLAEMVHLRQGVPIYAPASAERFDASIYGPLYYLLGARLIDPRQPEYRPIRLLSLLGALGCAGACALLAFRLGGGYLGAAFAPLILFSYGSVTRHMTSARCDSIALFLCFCGFVIAHVLKQRRGLLLATIPMILGFYYKPQYVAGPLAVLLFLVLERRYRLAAQFGGLLALGGLGLLALFQFVVFPGQDFFLHSVIYTLLPFAWPSLLRGALFFAVVLAVPSLVAAGHLRKNPNKLVACYLGWAIFLGLATNAKEGSGGSLYFLEAVLVLSTILAAFFARRLTGPNPPARIFALLTAILILAQPAARPAPNPQDFARDDAIQEFLRHSLAPGTEAIGFYVGGPLRAGLDVPISDIYQYVHLIRMGRLSDSDLLAAVRDRRYGLIVLNYDLRAKQDHRTDYMIASLRQAILENYQVKASLELPRPQKLEEDDRFYAWVPLPGSDDDRSDGTQGPAASGMVVARGVPASQGTSPSSESPTPR